MISSCNPSTEYCLKPIIMYYTGECVLTTKLALVSIHFENEILYTRYPITLFWFFKVILFIVL